MKAKILIGILFLLGVAILLYPMVSDYINSLSQAQVVEHFSDEVSRMEQAELEREIQRAKDYNSNLARTIVIDPFTETMDQELSSDYENILNINGQMGVITIPKINVELPIYHGTGPAVLQKGVGHLPNTAFPVGGEGTHAVLSGHRGLPEAKLFSDLDELELGDKFYIKVLNQTLAYTVDEIKVVEPHQTESLKPVDGKDYVTLVTCTPYGVNSHRLLVRGIRTAYTPEAEVEIVHQQVEMKQRNYMKQFLFAAVILITLIFLYFLFFGSHKKKRRKKKRRKRKRKKRRRRR